MDDQTEIFVRESKIFSDLPKVTIVSINKPRSHARISYGVIIYAKDTESILLVRSGESYAYRAFRAGEYFQGDLPMLLSYMTHEEYNKIRKLFSSEIPHETIFGNNEFSLTRYLESYSVLEQAFRTVPPSSLNIQRSSIYGFPKGKKNKNEKGKAAALREFFEETCIEQEDLENKAVLVSDEPVTNSYVSFDHETYSTACWVYIVDSQDDFKISNTNSGLEICECRWVPFLDLDKYLNNSKVVLAENAMAEIVQYFREI